MSFTIRPAQPADLEAVGQLYGAVCDGLRDKPYNPGWQRDGFPTAANAQKFLDEGGLLLAWDGTRLAGSVGFTPNPSAEVEEDSQAFSHAAGPEGVWYIHVLAVHPDFLRQGLASRLLAQAQEAVRASGGTALRLYVWENNSPAVAAYEKNGYACLETGVDIGLAELGLERFSLYEKPLG